MYLCNRHDLRYDRSAFEGVGGIFEGSFVRDFTDSRCNRRTKRAAMYDKLPEKLYTLLHASQTELDGRQCIEITPLTSYTENGDFGLLVWTNRDTAVRFIHEEELPLSVVELVTRVVVDAISKQVFDGLFVNATPCDIQIN